MSRFRILVAAAALTLGAGAGRAADAAGGGDAPAGQQSVGGQRQRRTILHFGEDDIRGDITRPDGELVQAPRRISEDSLLRVRRSFIDRALAAPLRGR